MKFMYLDSAYQYLQYDVIALFKTFSISKINWKIMKKKGLISLFFETIKVAMLLCICLTIN